MSYWHDAEPLFVPPDRDAPEEECEVSFQEDADPARQRMCVEALIASNARSMDHRLGQSVRWARENEDNDLAWRAMQRYRPMAMCSVDDRPQRYAAMMAEFCAQTGRTSRAVRLYTTTLRHAFPRQSDVIRDRRPLSYVSPVRELSAHVDIHRFLLGMVARDETEDDRAPSVPLHFLALSIVDQDARDDILSALEGWIAEESTSEFVRWRALEVWTRTRTMEGLAGDDLRDAMVALPGVDTEAVRAMFEE